MIPPMKRCCKCRETRPASEFHRNKKRRDGFNPSCKACVSAYYHANAGRIMARQKATQTSRVAYVELAEKRCPHCGETKIIDAFHRDKRNTHGRTDRCKVCIIKESSTYYQENREQCIASCRKYVDTHKEHCKDRHRRWFDRVRARRYAQMRSWAQNNPDRMRRYGKISRARMQARGHRATRRDVRYRDRGKHTTREWRALRAFFGDRCLCCGATDRLSVDHVIPLSKGGRNEIDNLQPLCMPCNLRKGAAVIDYRQPELLAAFLATMKP